MKIFLPFLFFLSFLCLTGADPSVTPEATVPSAEKTAEPDIPVPEKSTGITVEAVEDTPQEDTSSAASKTVSGTVPAAAAQSTPGTSQTTPQTAPETVPRTTPTPQTVPETKQKTPETKQKTPETKQKTPETKQKTPDQKGQVTRAKNKVRPIRFIQHKGTRYVLLYDVADFYQLTSYYSKTGVVMYSKGKRIEMFYNKREGSINGTKVYFLAPILYLNKRPYITDADFLKVIDPVLRNKSIKQHKLTTIMLDPGHGGKDQGAPGPLLPEKQINFIIAKKLKYSLEKLGFKVLMTRDGDTFPELADRTALCARHKPDLFISIHCNSVAKKTVCGLETFLLTPAGFASTADKTGQPTVFKANDWDQNNFRLAYDIHRSLRQFTKEEDRGVRHARFYVLRNSSVPSILIECGFLSNRKEGLALAGNDLQNKLVAGIVVGIARYSKGLK